MLGPGPVQGGGGENQVRKVTTISLCMEPELAEHLRETAAAHGLSVSAYVRLLLKWDKLPDVKKEGDHHGNAQT